MEVVATVAEGMVPGAKAVVGVVVAELAVETVVDEGKVEAMVVEEWAGTEKVAGALDAEALVGVSLEEEARVEEGQVAVARAGVAWVAAAMEEVVLVAVVMALVVD